MILVLGVVPFNEWLWRTQIRMAVAAAFSSNMFRVVYGKHIKAVCANCINKLDRIGLFNWKMVNVN
jgi:hypothetical protein